jgi:putative DNA primase/helicase
MLGSAHAVAQILGGRREGRGYLCHCPVKTHGKQRGDKRPSLSVNDGDKGVILHCFAGCDPRDVFAAINGLCPNTRRGIVDRPALSERSTPKTTSGYARRLWRSALSVPGTIGERFLRERGLPTRPPASIRFLPSYRYDRRRARSALPCLIAAAQEPTREIVGVQLTFLHPGGRRKADVEFPRRTIGPLGASMLRLAQATPSLGIAEGFEKAWAAQLLFGEPVWATLGADRFGVVNWPNDVTRLTIYADNDAPGLKAARELRAAHPEITVRILHCVAEGQDFDKLYKTVAADRGKALQRIIEE